MHMVKIRTSSITGSAAECPAVILFPPGEDTVAIGK
jgi:hypothetical protein